VNRTPDTYAHSQQLFADALHSPVEQHPALELFAGPAAGHVRKLALYRGNLHGAWIKALENAYPVLKALVGEEFFNGLAIFYGKTVPSQAGDLNLFGEGLPAFIRTFAAVAAYPYFADLASLEWALHRAHYADDVVPWSVQQWMETDSTTLLDAHMAIHPACALVSSNYAITRVWQAHQVESEVTLPEDLDLPSHALIVRESWWPSVLDISAAAHAMFDQLMVGKSLGDALDAALTLDPDFDFAGQWRTWIALHAVTGASMPTPGA
jgi:Putative DNA-binding domain